jgi:hypothetical protein
LDLLARLEAWRGALIGATAFIYSEELPPRLQSGFHRNHHKQRRD